METNTSLFINSEVEKSMSILLSRLIEIRDMKIGIIEDDRNYHNREMLNKRILEKSNDISRKHCPKISVQTLNTNSYSNNQINDTDRTNLNIILPKKKILSFNNITENTFQLNSSREKDLKLLEPLSFSVKGKIKRNRIDNLSNESPFISQFRFPDKKISNLVLMGKDIEDLRYRKMKESMEENNLNIKAYSSRSVIKTNEMNTSYFSLLPSLEKKSCLIDGSAEKLKNSESIDERKKIRINPVYQKLNYFIKKKDNKLPKCDFKDIKIIYPFDTNLKIDSSFKFRYLSKIKKINKV